LSSVRRQDVSRVGVGTQVPDFTVAGTGGEWRLAQNAGEKLVVYFYPKAMTSGCTTESQAFRDLHGQFRRAKTKVVGVSRDGLASQQKFKAKERLPFDLLADEDERVCRLFDVIHEKNMYGRKMLGIVRSTFLIDARGVLQREWRKVKVAGHAEEVLEAAKSL
jgi:thioredoxin-dependent peroxiredoxin